jgi:hypothetical protein
MKNSTVRVECFAFVVAAICSVATVVPGAAFAATLTAMPSNFASVFASAQGGDTILLAAGSYGTFTGALKAGLVTIMPQGATATMALNFSPASNITIDGLTLTSVYMNDSRTKNITVRNSTFTGQTTFRTGTLANANILFDRNVHGAWNAGAGGGEGRVWLPERTSQPSGITIQNSRFGPGGNSDGIQNGSNGTRILNNEFVGIKQIDGAAGVHADSIQLYGSQNTVIRSNWFHDVSVGIMCADGCDHETIEDNVFAVNGSPYAVTLLSDNGSVIRHNTFLDYGTCDYSQRCGQLYLGNKSADPVSQGTILKDNIVTSFCVCDGRVSGLAEESYNLFTKTTGSGANDVFGKPTYVGGANPTTLTGFQLAAGSPGIGNASDGLDRGARFSPQPTPLAAPRNLRLL